MMLRILGLVLPAGAAGATGECVVLITRQHCQDSPYNECKFSLFPSLSKVIQFLVYPRSQCKRFLPKCKRLQAKVTRPGAHWQHHTFCLYQQSKMRSVVTKLSAHHKRNKDK